MNNLPQPGEIWAEMNSTSQRWVWYWLILDKGDALLLWRVHLSKPDAVNRLYMDEYRNVAAVIWDCPENWTRIV